MQLLLDTLDLKIIDYYQKALNISGITSNPTIVKRAGDISFFKRLRQIYDLLGDNSTLHVQVVGTTLESMMSDAYTVLDKVGSDVFIKVPTNMIGLTAMKKLKKNGVHVTATAIYSKFQGYLAILAGADYLAPYYNRMLNMNIDANGVIRALAEEIHHKKSSTEILAASFHNINQVTCAIESGAQNVTLSPSILESGIYFPALTQTVADFTRDWESIYGSKTTINSLVK